MQCPAGSLITHGSTDSKLLWITLTPIEVGSSTVYDTKGGSGLQLTGKQGEEIWLLAPSNIMESVTHTWDSYESIASRLAGAMVKIRTIGGELKNLGNVAGSANRAIMKGQFSNLPNTTLGALGQTVIPANRIDTPLVYSSSERREYTFDFQLMPIGMTIQQTLDIVWIIHGYSAPIKSDDGIEIKLPWVWKVWSNVTDGNMQPIDQMGGLINLEQAALTAIQPTFHGPYIDGLPQWTTLTLTFKELPPLYAQSVGIVPGKEVT